MPALLTNADIALITLMVVALLVGWSREWAKQRAVDTATRERHAATAARYKQQETT